LKSQSTENELLRIQSGPFPSSPEISNPVISDTLLSARFHPYKSGEQLHTLIEDFLNTFPALYLNKFSYEFITIRVCNSIWFILSSFR